MDKNIETGFVREGMAELVCFALVNPGQCFQIDCLEPTGRKETWCGIVIERKREGKNRVGKKKRALCSKLLSTRLRNGLIMLLEDSISCSLKLEGNNN